MSATIEQLENIYWGDDIGWPSGLVIAVHRLRRKPIDEFTVEDLRIMIGQDIALKYLLPKAMEVLRADPLAAGDFYEGDLLKSVIGCNFDEVETNADFRKDVAGICQQALSMKQTQALDDFNEYMDGEPGDYGLDAEAFEALQVTKINEVLAIHPWPLVSEFAEKFGQ